MAKLENFPGKGNVTPSSTELLTKMPGKPPIFFSFFPEANESQGVAYAPKGVTFEVLYNREYVANWKILEFSIRDGDATDYLANNLGWHMCSPRLRALIEAQCTGREAIQWLPCFLGINGTRFEYYIMHIFQAHEVLSRRFTIYSGDHLVKPVINASAARDLNSFAVPGSSVGVYTSARAKEGIEKGNVTGLALLKVATVLTDDV